MNDPSTRPDGRHAATAGSLTVAELLARHSEAERQRAERRRAPPARTSVQLMPVPAAQHRSSAPAVTEPQGRGGTLARPGRARRASRMVLAGGTTVVLLGSLAAAAVQGAPPSQRSTPAATAQPNPVTGTDALRPDLLDSELLAPGRPGAVPPAAVPTAADSTEGAIDTTATDPTPLIGTARSAPAPGAPGRGTGSADPGVRLVEDFLESLPVNPDSATTFLHPALTVVDPVGFRESWRGVRDVDVLEVARRPDGRIRVAMILVQESGQRLRTGHLLTVTGGPRPRVIDVVLLSAQRG